MHPDLVLILARQRQEELRAEARSERDRPVSRGTDPLGVRGRAVLSLRSLADRLEAGQPRRI